MRSRPIRLSLTLPGSASLGAFQAGAVAGLTVVIDELRRRGRPVVVDAIGGASAGSIVALLTAHCLLTGKDAPTLLRRAWVDEVDVGLLRSNGRDAPLGFTDLEEGLRDLLHDAETHPADPARAVDSPLAVQVGLTSLLGLTTTTKAGVGESLTLTYADWAEFVLEPGSDVGELFEPTDGSLFEAVLASATHPGAFAPRLLDRSHQRDAYQGKGITNFPESGRLWYADGGLVESEPVGRVLDAARRVSGDAEGRRIHVVIDPRSSGASGNEEWGDPDDRKSWIDGLRRSMAILPTQALHDDLRRVASVNARLGELDHLMDELQSVLPDDVDVDWTAVRSSVAGLARIEDKQAVDVEMISPLLLADSDNGVSDLLAGDFIGAFGGFLNRRIRQSDYRLGWDCIAAWLPDALERHSAPDETIDEIVEALENHEERRSCERLVEDDGIDQLGMTDRWQLARLALSAGVALVADALPRPQLPDAVAKRLRNR